MKEVLLLIMINRYTALLEPVRISTMKRHLTTLRIIWPIDSAQAYHTYIVDESYPRLRP
jgi:hypothetical protein